MSPIAGRSRSSVSTRSLAGVGAHQLQNQELEVLPDREIRADLTSSNSRWIVPRRSADPRMCATGGSAPAMAFNKSVSEAAQRAMGLIDDAGEPIIDPGRGRKTPEQGAATIAFAATSPLLAGHSG
ncbi:hypothetical protein [Amycolatopsis saalfeldensis]|nr:hypothetical protein [Amycolatopsis saalfeldensis]